MARASEYADKKMLVVRDIHLRLRRQSPNPSVRELATKFGVSPATMHSWLKRLEKEGMVEWTPGRHRSLRVTPQGIQLLS